jgi:hypothetical protein
MQSGVDLRLHQRIDDAMALDAALASKCLCLDDDANVRCLPWNSPGMTGMQSALVDHLEPRRRERACQTIPDSLDRTHIPSTFSPDHTTVTLAAQNEVSATPASLYRLNRRIIIGP